VRVVKLATARDEPDAVFEILTKQLQDKFPHRVNLVSALEDYQLDRRNVYRPRGLQQIRTNARGLNQPALIVLL
jgi:hypothetical protein